MNNIFRWFQRTLGQMGKALRAGILRAAKGQTILRPFSAHLITLSQTLPCLMTIFAIEKPKNEMNATMSIAPHI